MPERWEMSENLRRQMVEIARDFRKQPTRGEAILWSELRGRKLDAVRFRREQPIGPFVVDFYASAYCLIVEVDGGVHDDPIQAEADRRRQGLLEELGLRFCRVRTEAVEANVSRVLATIQAVVATCEVDTRRTQRVVIPTRRRRRG